MEFYQWLMLAILCFVAVYIYAKLPLSRTELGIPVMMTDGGKLFARVGLNDECPDCNGRGFWRGPSGGMSRNLYCMNNGCRSGFNVTYFSETDGTCERIGRIDDQRYGMYSRTRWKKEMA